MFSTGAGVPGPVLPERFQRRNPLAGERFELLLEICLVVGDEFSAVVRAADLDIEHLLLGEVGVVRLDGGDHCVDGPALQRMYGGRLPDSGPVGLALVLANAVGVVMLLAGILDPGPASFMGKPREEPTGVYRITRHPVFMGVTVMALAHTIANGHASDVAFFSGLAAFSLAGCWRQDLRKLAAGDPAYERFHAATAFLPFTRRGAMRGLRELSPLAVITGIALALAARCLHPSAGGCGVFP